MFTITSQGTFISDGLSRIIQVPQGIDWFKVVNTNNIANQTASSGVEWWWYRTSNMPVNDAFVTYINAAGTALMPAENQFTGAPFVNTGGFTLFDSTTQLPALQGTTVTTSNAVNPTVTTTAVGAGEYGTTHMSSFRTVVRLNYNAPVTGPAPSICGIDYTVNVLTATTFRLPTHANAIPPMGAGQFYIASYTSDPLFYPTERTIINIVADANPTQARITTSVNSPYTVGQSVRFYIPKVSHMIQLDQLIGTVVRTNLEDNTLGPNRFVVDIDVTGFTPFTWPLLADYHYKLPQVVPVGETAQQPYVQSYLDATNNVGLSGMILGAGIDAATDLLSPAGTAGDTVTWQAGKVVNL